ncbi:hypothetical protein EVAR_23652_1 [Eumeta japonica]|uniref:Uncharacterized protein n=1 Tax=Eumeta variegata TaxID=151549 RepID=A0A4C1VJI2_EUMVA|nr:hypothetical protein EVAR_23652_1 [Eumeta japonica]
MEVGWTYAPLQREKWSKQVTVWYPRDGFRSRGRKAKRWEDDLIMTLGPLWTRVAADRQQWKELEEAFAFKLLPHSGHGRFGLGRFPLHGRRAPRGRSGRRGGRIRVSR